MTGAAQERLEIMRIYHPKLYETMKPKEFYELVKEMRREQKAYFRMRTTASLEASKRLEKQVDDEIERVEEILHPKPKQMDFFNNI